MSKQRAFEKGFNKAVEAFQNGQFRQADKILNELMRRFGPQPHTTHLAGFVHLQLGHLDVAERALTEAMRHFAGDANIHNALGVIANRRGKPLSAEKAFQQALNIDPSNFEARRNLADLFLVSGRAVDAAKQYGGLLRQRPGAADTVLALARALEASGDMEGALRALETFLEAHPENFDVLARLGELAHENARYEDARGYYRRALTARDDPVVGSALGGIELLTGDVAHGIQRQKSYFESPGITAQAASPYVQNLNYLPATSASAIRSAAETWAKRHAVKTPPLVRNPGLSILRVGLLTARVWPHPVRSFSLPWLTHRNAEKIEVHLFTTAPRPLTGDDPYRAAFDEYHDLSHDALEAALSKIRSAAPDVMITPTGHEEGGLLRLFTAPLAPVQVAAFAIFGTTGIREMTAIVGDRHHIPQGSEDTFTETVVRMPDGYICYRPSENLPDLSAADRAGRPPTFGCFNNLAKICDRTLSLWAKVLAAADGSRLVLRAPALAGESVREAFAKRMSEAGMDVSKVSLRGALPHRALLEAYGEMDVALDPLAYSGGVTTLEALWMGVPVVTMPGGTFARRHSLSHLMTAGMPEFVAENEDDYVKRAADAMRAARAGASFRRDIRARIADSPLSDERTYAGNFDKMLLELAG